MATAEGFVRRLTRRLTENPEERGAQRAIDCCRGQEVTMVGRLRSVETNAKGCAGGVRAELFDGTDTVTLVWLGQRRIPGIECGRHLRVRGRLGVLDNGGKAIYNPHYEIQR
jgi:hypothetical protein